MTRSVGPRTALADAQMAVGEAGADEQPHRPLDAAAQAPQDDRPEQAGRQRIAPEGDQPAHGRTSVKSADMSPGVAKLYKQVVNAAESVSLNLFQGPFW